MYRKVLIVLALAAGLASTLAYASLWLAVWINDGKVLCVFKWWIEWHIEPWLLFGCAILQVTGLVLGFIEAVKYTIPRFTRDNTK